MRWESLALIAVITDPKTIKAEETFSISCEATDYEYLFYDWINALIYEIEVRKMLFCSFDVKIDNLKLEALIMGEKINPGIHHPTVGIKGATLTELKVEQKNGIWIAQCIIDV